MSWRYPEPLGQAFEHSSPSPVSRYENGKSDTSRNANGKRSRDHLQQDQLETPPKLARLDDDHLGEQKRCQRPSNPTTNDSIPNREQNFTTGPGHVIFIEEEVSRREVQESNKALEKAQSVLENLRSSHKSTGVDEAKKLAKDATANQEAIEAEIPGLIEARRQYETLAQENKLSKSRLDHSREIAHIVIERILNKQNLLDIPSSKAQDSAEANKGISWEPAPVVERAIDPTSNLDPESESEQSPMNGGDQTTPRQLALRHLRFAAEELTYWKDELVYMQDEYPQAVAAEQRYRRDQHPNRPASTTQTDIDLMILKNTQDATRKVIEAEEAFDRAEARAEGLGLGDILADPHACHYGEIYNEFQPPRAETNVVVMLPAQRSRIEAWMASVPDLDGVDSLPREGGKEGEVEVIVDDWDVKSVELWDSVSLAAHDLYRKKIDTWQKLAGRLREGGS